MGTVLTLVAARGALDEALVARAAGALAAHGPGSAAWLSPGTACDLPFEGRPSMADARAALGDAAVDVTVQAARGRRKRLLLADMDSTIVTGETLDEMAARAGLGEKIAAITARAMNGELDFREALRERVGMLAGHDAAIIAQTLAEVRLSPGAETLARTMAAHGARTLLVSGGFTQFTEAVRDRAGFHEDRANRLEVAGGRLTGRVVEPILDKDAKHATLREAASTLGIGLDATVAVGDGANDLPMILAAERAGGLGVAYRAKPTVRAAAAVSVCHADLTALLYFQGYREAEFRAPTAAADTAGDGVHVG